MATAIWYFLGGGPPGTESYFGRLRADGLDAVMVCPRGLDADWIFAARAVDPGVITLAFDPAMAISGRVWAGLDEPTLATLTGSWIDAAEGTGRLTLAAADAADLAPGTYNVLATIEADGRGFELHSGLLRVLPAPGVGVAPAGPQYATYEEVRELAHWLDDARRMESDTARWARAIDRGSRWADSVGVGRARRHAHAGVPAWPADPILTTSTWHGWGDPEAFADAIAEALADGRLDASDPRLREAVARYAIAQVPGGERKAGDLDRERRHAIALMLGVVLKVDLDDDGEYEVGLTA